jgi:hypothetical protein
MKIIKSLLLIIMVLATTSFTQSDRYTKGAENGNMWLAMDDPTLPYSVSKENYLSSILDRIRVTGEKYPEIASLTCRDDINKLYNEGESDNISLEDVVKKIDSFYSHSDNLVIPIIFAYCYTIKKFAGASTKELKKYREDVLKFCYE